MSVLRFCRPVQLIPVADDRAYVLDDGGASYEVRLPDADLAGVLGALVRGATLEELSLFAADGDSNRLVALIEQFEHAGVVGPAPDPDPAAGDASERFTAVDWYCGAEPAARLRSASVLLVGLGSLGSWTVQHLVAAGIGRIVGVDPDHVSLANLAKLSLYAEADVGRPKVEAAGDAIAAASRFTDFVPRCELVEGPEQLIRALDEHPCDLTVLTADTPRWTISRWAAEAAMATGVPLLRATSLGVGPLMMPGETACPACEWPRVKRNFPDAEELLERRRRLRGSAPRAISTEVSIHGAVLADEVVAFLSGARPLRTIGARVRVDLRRPALEIEDFERDPGCPVCAPTP